MVAHRVIIWSHECSRHLRQGRIQVITGVTVVTGPRAQGVAGGAPEGSPGAQEGSQKGSGPGTGCESKCRCSSFLRKRKKEKESK
jgi:hypothetical protein